MRALIAAVQLGLGLVNNLFCAMMVELFDVCDGRRAHGRHVLRMGPTGIASSMAGPRRFMVGNSFYRHRPVLRDSNVYFVLLGRV